jgi:preprotein translocase subunit SecD
MNKNLRWKLITSFAVFVIFFSVGVYPIMVQRFPKLPAPSWLMAHQLRLGLDLKGGVHLVLRVQPDDALRLQTTTSSCGRPSALPGSP